MSNSAMVERILLTGANGFVGSYLTPALAARWPGAVVTGIGSGLSLGELADSGTATVDLLDPSSLAAVIRTHNPDLIVHLAAQSSVALAGADSSTWSVNLTGSLNLAQAVVAHAPNTTLLFASTAEVYGASFLGSPVSETSIPVPMNAYAQSKLLAEQMFMHVLPPSARLIIARPFNHTGAGQREVFVLPSFAGQVARIEAGLQAPCIRTGNLDVRRDFLDVRDVVAAYIALIETAPRLPMRFVCNIASGRPRKLRDLLDILRRLSPVPFEIEIDPARLRPIDLPVAYSDPALLRLATGWSATIDLEKTMSGLLDAARRVHAA